MPIFSRYAGAQSPQDIERRKRALGELAPGKRTVQAKRSEDQAVAVAGDPAQRMTALQQLQSRKAETGVGPKAPFSVARSGGSSDGTTYTTMGKGPANNPAPKPVVSAPPTIRPPAAPPAQRPPPLTTPNLPPGLADAVAGMGAGGTRGPGTSGPGAAVTVGVTPGNNPGNPFDLGAIQQQQARDRAAMNEQWRVAGAQANADAQARAGLGGFALSGAANALVGDNANEQARLRTLALQDLGSRQRQELTQAAIDYANMQDAVDNGLDVPGFDPSEGVITPSQQAAQDDIVNRLTDTFNPHGAEPDTGPGTQNRPFVISSATMKQLQAAGLDLQFAGTPPAGAAHNDRGKYYSDGQGRFFYIKDGT